jgi:exodeoxyribonuclease VIII
MKFKTGIYHDLDYPTYDSIPAWRSHDLTSIAKCPFTWRYAEKKSESPALLEGRVQHTVFLELEKFWDEFILEPDVNKRTKVGKQEYEDWLEGVGDRTPVKQDLIDVCMARRDVLIDYVPKKSDQVELTVCFEWFGHPCKAKIDWYDGINVWDLKTCRDASPRGFRSAINNFLYFQQAAFYLTACRHSGLTANKFYFLAVEKAAPYPYGVYTLSETAIQYGIAKNEQALNLGISCKQDDSYLPFNRGDEVTEFSHEDLY